MRADRSVDDRGEKRPEIISGVHVSRALRAPRLRPFFGDEYAAQRPFAPDSDAGEESEDRELPDVRRHRAEEREQRIKEDGEHERRDTAESVGDRSPEECESPSDEKNCE